MRKMKILAALVIIFGFVALLAEAVAGAFASGVYAAGKKDEVQWMPMEATAYCYGEITADGSRVREGICAAKKDWIGLTAMVYLDEEKEDGTHGPGEFMGYYEIKDTGGNELIKSGQAIDIYNPSAEWCREFGRKKVWVVLREGKG